MVQPVTLSRPSVPSTPVRSVLQPAPQQAHQDAAPSLSSQVSYNNRLSDLLHTALRGRP
ncbi:MAG: hypothetical protein ACYCW6_25890 [Candidatus Xenobia bacterium]